MTTKTLIVRAKTFRDWMRANFTAGELRDIVNHGVDCGWHGLTYTADTVKLFDKYEEEIWGVLADMADDMGQNVLGLMATFRRADMADTVQGMKNLAVWAVAEYYADQEGLPEEMQEAED